MTAASPTAGHFETFYISCPGGVRDGSVVQVRAVGDNAILGIDPEEYLKAGRAPHLDLAVQKVGGQPGPEIQDGDTIALRKPSPAWLPGAKYVRADAERGLVRFGKGKRGADAEFVVVKAREILKVEAPEQGEGAGKVTLKEPAPTGGVPIQLSSSHPDLIDVQKSVVIPEGARDISFQCKRISQVAAPADVVITATAVATGYGVPSKQEAKETLPPGFKTV